jgi:hypothetical protein
VVRAFQTALLLVGVLCIWFALSMTAKGQDRYTRVPETFTVTVIDQGSVGLQFFELRFSDGSAAILSVDEDVPFCKALKAAKGKQRLTLEGLTLQEIGR